MPKAKTLFFTSPKQTEIRETILPTLKDDEVLVETIYSAISAGTEMLVYRGQFPRLSDSHDDLSSDYLKIFSGDAPTASNPQLIIEYHLP
mgnify:CR=1 FL=1